MSLLILQFYNNYLGDDSDQDYNDEYDDSILIDDDDDLEGNLSIIKNSKIFIPSLFMLALKTTKAPEATEGFTEASTTTTATEAPTKAPTTTKTYDLESGSGSGGNYQ